MSRQTEKVNDKTIEAMKRALIADLGAEDVEYEGETSFGYGANFESSGAEQVDESEWMVFEDEDDAKAEAVERTEEDYETGGPNFFKQEIISKFLYITDTDRRLISQEEGDSYASDIREDDDGSRLIDEANDIKRGIQDKWDDLIERENDDEDVESEKEDLLDEAQEIVSDEIAKRAYDEMEDPIEYFVNEQGMYSSEDLVQVSFIQVNVEKMAKYIVNSDGIAHTLDYYDGQEEEIVDPITKKRFYAYGTN